MSTIIPFGPQHPVLPEPLHLQLTVENEIVTQALPTIGYVHRGLERLAQKKDFHQMVQVVERVCGICSCIHAATYCQGIEELMDIEVPERAEYLRVIWSELHRMHSHLLWLGLMADSFGLESLFMQCWRIREQIMDVMEATAGNRVIISVNQIGGVRRDLNPAQLAWIQDVLKKLEKDFLSLKSIFSDDYSVRNRTVGIGLLPRARAYELGAAGPTLRGSAVAEDIRMTGYGAYKHLDFQPMVEQDGDCWSRTMVRFREVLQSIDLVRQAIAKLPQGELAVPVKGRPEGEVVMRTEQPRGEVMYYIKASGNKFLDRCRIRTPTFANIPPLLEMLPNAALANVPVIVLSIDPCISCTER
jgi:ech hydrogenase subunit E